MSNAAPDKTPSGQDSGSADSADAAATSPNRIRDGAAILPILGLALFSPPLIGLFVRDVSIFGAPLIVAYAFAVWLALIFAAQRMSRHLVTREDV